MSELKIPDFMQVYLDKLDGDEAYPEFYKLAKKYNDTIERLKNNAGFHKASGELQKLLDGAKADFQNRAYVAAKKHGLSEQIKDEKDLSKEKKSVKTVENFKKEDPQLEATKDDKELDLSAKQEKFLEAIEKAKEKHTTPPVKEELPEIVKPVLDQSQQDKNNAERAKLLEEMRAARERSQQQERER